MDKGQNCNQGKMTPARAAALEGVPGWAWEVNAEAVWEEKLAALRAYVGVHGRLPPRGDAAGLGSWISVQRRSKKAADAGRKSAGEMTPVRAAALEGVPGWAWAPRAVVWEERLAALRAYGGAHGRPPVPSDASVLGTWVRTQRWAKKAMDAGRKSNTKMTPERAAALEGVPGWAWDVGLEMLWQEKLNALRAYVDAHGRLPQYGDAAGLGTWISVQRRSKKAADACSTSNTMTPARAAALEAVPGWSWYGRRRAAAPAAPLAKRAKKAGQ